MGSKSIIHTVNSGHGKAACYTTGTACTQSRCRSSGHGEAARCTAAVTELKLNVNVNVRQKKKETRGDTDGTIILFLIPLYFSVKY